VTDRLPIPVRSLFSHRPPRPANPGCHQPRRAIADRPRRRVFPRRFPGRLASV